MKKASKLFALLVSCALILGGCAQNAEDEDPVISAPDMGSATDLPATGAIAPATETEAVELYMDSSAALNSLLAANLNNSIRSLKSVLGAARETVSNTEPINFSYTTANDGTMVYKGTYTYSSTRPDITKDSIQPNTTYTFSVSSSGNINGTLTNAQASDNNYTYTITGTTKELIDVSANIYLKTGIDLNTGSDATYSMGFSFSSGFGSAFSIKRDDGIGAKFIISYSVNYSKGNISVDNIDFSAFEKEIKTYLLNQPATLKVYNDSNELVYETTLTAEDLYKYSVFDNI